jgi:hypothetical protein
MIALKRVSLNVPSNNFKKLYTFLNYRCKTKAVKQASLPETFNTGLYV